MLTKKIDLGNSARLNCFIYDKQISYSFEKKRPAIIICPGGGYLFRASKEREPVAIEFMSRGYNCFVLDYSVVFPNKKNYFENNKSSKMGNNRLFPLPILQLMKSIHILKINANKWGINADQIFLLGFSAGAHLCAHIASRWQDNNLLKLLNFKIDPNEFKVNGVLLCYPLIKLDLNYQTNDLNPEKLKQSYFLNEYLFGKEDPSYSEIKKIDANYYVSKDTTPIFIWQTLNDKVVNPVDTTKFILNLQSKGVAVEYHLFSFGRHGLGLANSVFAKEHSDIDENIKIWPQLADNWIRRILNNNKGKNDRII